MRIVVPEAAAFAAAADAKDLTAPGPAEGAGGDAAPAASGAATNTPDAQRNDTARCVLSRTPWPVRTVAVMLTRARGLHTRGEAGWPLPVAASCGRP